MRNSWLEELSLESCAEFWGRQKDKVSAFEKLKLLSVTGGVPRYLEEINPKLTAEENIYRLCYRPEGVLFNEFDDIFADLFRKRTDYYKSIVTSIINGNNNVLDIADSLGRTKGGDLSRALKSLCQDNYIAREHSWNLKTGKIGKNSSYRVRDNYLRFYLKYIQPYKHIIENGDMTTLPNAWDSIMGLQFETLVINNRRALHRILNIPGDNIVMSNPYLQTQTKVHERCQIDYLVQTKFNTLYLCEIKFKKSEVKYDIIKEVQEKIKKLKLPNGFSVRPVLIHVNGVSDKVIAEDYFSNIINFAEFLN